MQISEDCILWLRDNLRSEIIIEAWLFGSAVKSASGKIISDVDVYIKYKNGLARNIPSVRREIEINFLKIYKIPLHFLALSEIESLEEFRFLDNALKEALRII